VEGFECGGEGKLVPMLAFELPEPVRNRAIAEGAQAWLDGLPELLAELEREWAMTIRLMFSGGSEAFVGEVTLDDGSPAVLKVLIPREDDSAKNEITVLRLADGDGCAKLLRSDVARSAMLLEKLGPMLNEFGLPVERKHEILCTTVQRLWRHAPDSGLPTGAAKGRWLIDYITTTWEDLGRPCSEAAVDYALACASRRIAAHDDERAVLVHGDVHEWNALQAGDGWKLIDPDGLLAEAEYDLGVIMREDPVERLASDPHARSRRLAELTGLNETAIWEWAAVERLSSGLVLVSIELQEEGRRFLATAEYVALLARSSLD
jgi:streptomycin 6-kinase